MYMNATGKLTSDGQRLAKDLYDPSIATLSTWLKSGDIAGKARFGKLPPQILVAAMTDRYLREEIALDTFVATLPGFMRKLDAGVHDPARSSIQTFFIGDCRNRVGDVIRDRQEIIHEAHHDTAELLAKLQSPTADFGAGFEEIEGLGLARDLLLRAPHDLRDVLLLRVYDGITIAEAGKRLGLKGATVRSHLSRYKSKLITLHLQGKIVIPDSTVLGEWLDTKADAGRDCAWNMLPNNKFPTPAHAGANDCNTPRTGCQP